MSPTLALDTRKQASGINLIPSFLHLCAQFVPQLMLGNPLCKSSGPPLYKPKWELHHSWVLGSQYFFEVRTFLTRRGGEEDGEEDKGGMERRMGERGCVPTLALM